MKTGNTTDSKMDQKPSSQHIKLTWGIVHVRKFSDKRTFNAKPGIT